MYVKFDYKKPKKQSHKLLRCKGDVLRPLRGQTAQIYCVYNMHVVFTNLQLRIIEWTWNHALLHALQAAALHWLGRSSLPKRCPTTTE